jgi:DNA-binding transcriptional MocR family regulator
MVTFLEWVDVVSMAATVCRAEWPAQPQRRAICTGTAHGLTPVYWPHDQASVPVKAHAAGTEFAMAVSDFLYRHVADALAQSIRAGTLARGERVPSVRATARHHSVSVATAVQAYRALEDLRLIEARPRSGYYVSARPASAPEPKVSRPPARAIVVDVGTMSAQLRQLANAPNYLSFNAVCPSGDLFDNDRVRRTVSRVVQRHRALLTQYPEGPGQGALRRAIARHALGIGCTLDAQQILVTNGCFESVSLALRAVTAPGDVVALESPTSFGFLEILQGLKLRALEIPTHPRTGMSLDALQLALDNHPVRAVLVVPALSNPLGSCMPPAERKRLAQMVAAHDIPLIEDVVYNDLAEQDDKRRAVKAHDTTGHVMVCGSFSKTVAPGFRLGWLAAGKWHEPVERLMVTRGGVQMAVVELALADLLSQPGREAVYRRLRSAIGARLDEARGLIAQSFPKGTRVTDPPGGCILWVELPAAVNARTLFEACLAQHIVIAPGELFSATTRYSHCIRLGLGGRWDDAQRRALCRIGETAQGLMA